MAEWDLHITYDNGTIGITNSATGEGAEDIEVAPGDTLKFKCEDHGWGIQFIGEGVPENSNRANPPVTPASVNGKQGDSATITVDRDATPGDRWDYVAAVIHDDKVHTRDPDIVIKNRPG
ncbi:MAG: hypothetical protein GWM90_17865 [Gemmatimonadetes bacterium]|nr:hypothetical protein [Gemmatimonadota bacterium]NIQ56221.1 hypothetical protein [Gemmatimonadota bacterium]NIU76410.1 hypothetical protein [Gammaproteobacteria bacterium]NIX45890.1 hypothetical protein [Gemmatimonadota bacterium]NIY10198.1 hypothetical protein [Gemmatimonadota bacterium]